MLKISEVVEKIGGDLTLSEKVERKLQEMSQKIISTTKKEGNVIIPPSVWSLSNESMVWLAFEDGKIYVRNYKFLNYEKSYRLSFDTWKDLVNLGLGKTVVGMDYEFSIRGGNISAKYATEDGNPDEVIEAAIAVLSSSQFLESYKDPSTSSLRGLDFCLSEPNIKFEVSKRVETKAPTPKRVVAKEDWSDEMRAMRDDNIESVKGIRLTKAIKDIEVVVRELRYPVELIGDAGTGKTTAARKVGAMLKLPTYVFGVESTTDKFGLLGSLTQDDEGIFRWVPNKVANIITQGGLLILDEWSTGEPDALTAINALLDGTGYITAPDSKTVLKVHESFRIICTSNIDYQGVKQINEATNNRFLQFTVGAPSVNDISKWLEDSYPEISFSMLNALKDIYMTLEGLSSKNPELVFSYRNIDKMASAMINASMDPSLAFKTSTLIPLFRNEHDVIRSLIKASSWDTIKDIADSSDSPSFKAVVTSVSRAIITLIGKNSKKASGVTSVFENLDI